MSDRYQLRVYCIPLNLKFLQKHFSLSSKMLCIRTVRFYCHFTCIYIRLFDLVCGKWTIVFDEQNWVLTLSGMTGSKVKWMFTYKSKYKIKVLLTFSLISVKIASGGSCENQKWMKKGLECYSGNFGSWSRCTGAGFGMHDSSEGICYVAVICETNGYWYSLYR